MLAIADETRRFRAFMSSFLVLDCIGRKKGLASFDMPSYRNGREGSSHERQYSCLEFSLDSN